MTSIDRDHDPYRQLLRNVRVDSAEVDDAMISAGVAREYGGPRLVVLKKSAAIK